MKVCFIILVAQLVKNLPAKRETWVRSMGWEDPLEKGKATTPVFRPGELRGVAESDMTKQLSLSLSLFWWEGRSSGSKVCEYPHQIYICCSRKENWLIFRCICIQRITVKGKKRLPLSHPVLVLVKCIVLGLTLEVNISQVYILIGPSTANPLCARE